MSRVVVLGPGGVPGTAWLFGLITGLRRAGIDLADADTIVGTSAGAIAGALLGGAKDLGAVRMPRPRSYAEATKDFDWSVLEQVAAIMEVGVLDLPVRSRLGRLALDAAVPSETDHVGDMYQLLGDSAWHPGLVLPVVDAESGEPVVWRAGDGMPLPLVVAAGTTMPGMTAPVTIDGHRYIDGAFRNRANADLADGATTVVLVEPMAHTVPTIDPIEAAHLVRIAPDAAARQALGTTLSDHSVWPEAFLAGMRQGVAAAPEVRAADWTRRSDRSSR
ncbi:patatin-like phospholipase family protein [Nocardia sp. alder85J]|uniref:patatin-like phospholipase family protein n=1 Tax=Nocardia sp. alder85J TaxID=2862949 RepID=UPI001CD25A4E|nr:patatin-like phospholipase family protein [Nocardia sp. alder85J]MCX4092559.1 patatin-like phospholipase family protein [Nocardia sp. alder85J]